MKATEHYFLAVPFIMLYKVALTLESEDSHENYSVAVLSFGAVSYAVQGGLFRLGDKCTEHSHHLQETGRCE